MSKGFDNFVSSIIKDKIKYNQKPIEQTQPSIQKVQEDKPQGDLALLQQIQELENKQSKNKAAPQDNRPRNVGLGYEKNMSQAEIEANSQIQRLKKQLNAEQNKNKDEKQEKQIKQNNEQMGKGSMVAKKGITDNKQKIIEERKEKKRNKKENQKLKKQQEQEKQQKQNQSVEKKEENPEDQEFIRKRKRTKTRSKQKNIRKDNRPEDVKRAKLAERGIII